MYSLLEICSAPVLLCIAFGSRSSCVAQDKKKKDFLKAVRTDTKMILLLNAVPHHKSLETAHGNYFFFFFFTISIII